MFVVGKGAEQMVLLQENIGMLNPQDNLAYSQHYLSNSLAFSIIVGDCLVKEGPEFSGRAHAENLKFN